MLITTTFTHVVYKQRQRAHLQLVTFLLLLYFNLLHFAQIFLLRFTLHFVESMFNVSITIQKQLYLSPLKVTFIIF